MDSKDRNLHVGGNMYILKLPKGEIHDDKIYESTNRNGQKNMPNTTKSKTTKEKNPTNVMAQRARRKQNRGNNAIADWESCNPQLLLRLVGAVTALKGTISFGYTRDGGAYYVNYYVDGVSDKEYVRPTEDIDMWLQEEIKSFEY